MTSEEPDALSDAQRDLRAWAREQAAKAPRISPADAAPLIAIFRGVAPSGAVAHATG